jgi:hypothetical protein
MISSRNPGRSVGLLYLLVSIPGVFALVYVPSKMIVHGDGVATITNIAASETLFRLGIAAELLCQALFIFVALALYHLFQGVNRRRATLMVILIAASIPIALLNELNSIAALVLVHGAEFLSSIANPQRDSLAMLFINLHGYGFDVAGIFWGLWLFPLGLLVYQSRFIPRILGVLLIAHGFAYIVNSLTSVVLPHYERLVSQWMMPFSLGEPLFMLWLLIMGAIPRPSETPSSLASVG